MSLSGCEDNLDGMTVLPLRTQRIGPVRRRSVWPRKDNNDNDAAAAANDDGDDNDMIVSVDNNNNSNDEKII